jgi:NapD protein
MNVSGILVVVSPGHAAASIEARARLDGIDGHQSESASDRIAIRQEAESIQSEVAGLKGIKALPHVIRAERLSMATMSLEIMDFYFCDHSPGVAAQVVRARARAKAKDCQVSVDWGMISERWQVADHFIARG